jgi:hypothetical protein
MSDNNNNNNNNNNKTADSSLSLLDRRVVVLLETPNDTSSRRHGISSTLERLHRLHGTSLIQEASQLLSVGASTFATACTIFHRFFHQCSLTEYDVWSVAMASTLLATKVEEEPHNLRTIIVVFAHLYRKRLLVATIDNKKDNTQLQTILQAHSTSTTTTRTHCCSSLTDMAESLTMLEKQNQLATLPPMSKIGPVYQEWHKQISRMEQILLRQLGFTLYWIPDSHPHKFILYFVRVLDIDDAKVGDCIIIIIIRLLFGLQ